MSNALTFRWAGAACVAAVLALASACANTQTVLRSTACFTDQPSTCARYEGDCYGAASNALPARSNDEANEMAASLACTARYGGYGMATEDCRLGLSFTAADRRASLAHFTFTNSSFEKTCP